MKPSNGLTIYKKAVLPICNRAILFSGQLLLLFIICSILYVCVACLSNVPFIITIFFFFTLSVDIVSLCFTPFSGLTLKKNGKVVLVTFFRISRYNINDLDKVYLSKNNCSFRRYFIKIKIVLKDKTIRYFDSSSQIKYNRRELAKKLYSTSLNEYRSFMNKTRDYDFIVFE